jgi:O-antigen/teichoic acid export membrane protein
MVSPFLYRVSRQMLLILSDKIFALLLNLLVAIAVARSIGPEQWGQLSYALALLVIIGPVMAFGLNTIVAKVLLQSPDKNNQVMATVFFMRLIASLVVLLCAGAALSFTDLAASPQSQVLLILLVSGLTHAFSVFEFWFQARMQLPVVMRARLLVVLCFAFLKLLALWANVNLFLLAAVYALELILLPFCYFYCYCRAGMSLTIKHFDMHIAKDLSRQSIWLVFSGIAAVLYLKIDQVMLLHLAGSYENGLYAVAVRLSEVWYVLPEVVLLVLFPVLVQSRADIEKYQHRLQQLSDLLMISAVALAILVSCFSAPLVRTLFGEEYSASAVMLQWHIWAGVFVFIRALASKYLLVAELHAFSLFSQAAGALINIALNFYFIPLYGGVGAAIATLISYAIAGYLVFWLYEATRPMARIMTKSLILPFTAGYRYWPMIVKYSGIIYRNFLATK